MHEVASWQEAETEARNLVQDQGLIVVMADRNLFSYASQMHAVPELLNSPSFSNNYILIYPFAKNKENLMERRAVNNVDDFAAIGKVIGKVFG